MKYRVIKVTANSESWYFPQYKWLFFWSFFTEPRLVGHILDEDDIKFSSLMEAYDFIDSNSGVNSSKPKIEVFRYTRS